MFFHVTAWLQISSGKHSCNVAKKTMDVYMYVHTMCSFKNYMCLPIQIVITCFLTLTFLLGHNFVTQTCVQAAMAPMKRPAAKETEEEADEISPTQPDTLAIEDKHQDQQNDEQEDDQWSKWNKAA